jgi:hypothetical protein
VHGPDLRTGRRETRSAPDGLRDLRELAIKPGVTPFNQGGGEKQAMANRRPGKNDGLRWILPAVLLAVVAGGIFMLATQEFGGQQGGNISQTTNPTNAPGTPKRP